MAKYEFREDLPGILVVSHGPLCEAVVESAKLIVGSEQENLVAVPVLGDSDIDAYGDEIADIYYSMPEGSIVLFDIQSGTPFNQMLIKSRGRHIDGLCGVNLPILIEALTMRDSLKGDELIQDLEEAAHFSIVDVAEKIAEMRR